MHNRVSVQQADFDVALLQVELLPPGAEAGAVATFTGYVRGSFQGQSLHSLYLEHYPGMTESAIEHILRDCGARWPLLGAAVVHRVGELKPGEQIVWVGVSAAHRGDAMAACECIIDYLKTQAPFWKRETGPEGSAWVEARDSDRARAARWHEDANNQNG